MNGYITVMRNYAVFSGRARRNEYWTFTLVYFLLMFTTGFFVGLSLSVFGKDSPVVLLAQLTYLLCGLVHLVPSLSVSVRRMHDIDKSAWIVLVGLIPIIGAIVLIILAATEGTRGPNRFGPDPKLDQAPSLSSMSPGSIA